MFKKSRDHNDVYEEEKYIMVISDNQFLQNGICSLFPNIDCMFVPFDSNIYLDLKGDAKIVIVVDSTILLKKSLSKLSIIMDNYPNSVLLWLYNDTTGFIYPAEMGWGGRINLLHVKSSVEVVKKTIESIFYKNDGGGNSLLLKYHLTATEYKIIVLLSASASFSMIMSILNISNKTLYSHVRNIIHKSGFKRYVFMQLLLSKYPFF